jgi:hypothetical protein
VLGEDGNGGEHRPVLGPPAMPGVEQVVGGVRRRGEDLADHGDPPVVGDAVDGRHGHVSRPRAGVGEVTPAHVGRPEHERSLELPCRVRPPIEAGQQPAALAAHLVLRHRVAVGVTDLTEPVEQFQCSFGLALRSEDRCLEPAPHVGRGLRRTDRTQPFVSLARSPDADQRLDAVPQCHLPGQRQTVRL